MILKVKMKLNPKTDIEVDFQASDLQDVIRNAGVFLDFDGKCGFCGSDNISLQTRITKEGKYKYTEFICRNVKDGEECGARRPMGKYQDGSGLFLKDWEEKYVGDQI